jgi:hypothetical protein
MPKRRASIPDFKGSDRKCPCDKTKICADLSSQKLSEDLWSHIICFLTHYRSWKSCEDNEIYQKLVFLSKSWHQRVQENQRYFVFHLISLTPFILKQIHCNALSANPDLDDDGQIILRNRIIRKWRTRFSEKEICRNLSKLSPYLEHLHLRCCKNVNLQMLTQLKSLSLDLDSYIGDGLLLPSNLTSLGMCDWLSTHRHRHYTIQCPEKLLSLSLTFFYANRVNLNPSLTKLDINSSTVPCLTHLTALTILKIDRCDNVPLLTHLTTLHTLNTDNWIEPMPPFIQHLRLSLVPNDFISLVTTLTCLQTLHLNHFQKKDAEPLMLQMANLREIKGFDDFSHRWKLTKLKKTLV